MASPHKNGLKFEGILINEKIELLLDKFSSKS
jgi:hypothetical protein